MQVEVNGARLWFDVDGPALVPDGPRMRERPTVVLLHGGPGSFDHSYFKPDFARLSRVAQVVYLDLRGHGRSQWDDPASWGFEQCADDVRGFCDAVGIARLACMIEARRYIGVKKRTANSLPVSRAAGYCTSEM